jgi:hypothetical protein
MWPGAALERLYAASDTKRAVMRVAAISGIPNLVLWPAEEASAAQRIIAA